MEVFHLFVQVKLGKSTRNTVQKRCMGISQDLRGNANLRLRQESSLLL